MCSNLFIVCHNIIITDVLKMREVINDKLFLLISIYNLFIFFLIESTVKGRVYKPSFKVKVPSFKLQNLYIKIYLQISKKGNKL